MCGIGGVILENQKDNRRALLLLRDILQSNSHRAKDCTGVLSYDSLGEKYSWQKDIGDTEAVLTDEILKHLSGSVCIGHLRWTTFGDTNVHNIHPIFSMYRGTLFGISHNGEMGTDELERWFPDYESKITTDTKLFAALISHSRKDTFEEAIQEACSYVKGTYSLLIQYKDTVYGIRDITGNRPLFYGKTGDAYLFSSESPAIEMLGRTTPKEVCPGTMVKVSQKPFCHEIIPIRQFPDEMPNHLQVCLFEGFYYMRPDSFYLGRRVSAIRERLGEILARHIQSKGVIMAVPDSGIPAAVGCARESGLPLRKGIVRSRFVGRYFIENKENRPRKLKVKFNYIPEEFAGEEVIICDDSIIEGITARHITERLHAAGARKVHWMISSPPTTDICPYGTPTGKQFRDLIASHYPLTQRIEGVRLFIKADSLCYLNIEETVDGIISTPPILDGYDTIKLSVNDFCTSCFTGMYKIPGNIPTGLKSVHS